MDRVAHALTVGARHEREGAPCADAAVVDPGPHGLFRIVVCDGAGSALAGDRGARLVADHVRWMLRSFERRAPGASALADPGAWPAIAARVVESARGHLERAAAASDVPLGELATTVLFGVVDRTGGRFAQVGDGALVVDAGGECTVPTAAPEAEYPDETVFVTAPLDALRAALSTAVVEGPIDGLLMMTDGLERLFLRFPRRTPAPHLLDWLVRDVARAASAGEASARLEALLRSDRVRARSDDDCTLVVGVGRLDAHRRPEASGVEAPRPRPGGHPVASPTPIDAEAAR